VRAARLAARCVELLGPVDGLVAVDAPPALRGALRARLAIADDGARAAAAVCVFLGEGARPAARRARLDALAARLPPSASVVVVDHNQPRAPWRRALGALLLVGRGHPPSRARYPVARELRDHGFSIERLGFADGERVQLVLGRRN
jgi:hypothetical protein